MRDCFHSRRAWYSRWRRCLENSQAAPRNADQARTIPQTPARDTSRRFIGDANDVQRNCRLGRHVAGVNR